MQIMIYTFWFIIHCKFTCKSRNEQLVWQKRAITIEHFLYITEHKSNHLFLYILLKNGLRTPTNLIEWNWVEKWWKGERGIELKNEIELKLNLKMNSEHQEMTDYHEISTY